MGGEDGPGKKLEGFHCRCDAVTPETYILSRVACEFVGICLSAQLLLRLLALGLGAEEGGDLVHVGVQLGDDVLQVRLGVVRVAQVQPQQIAQVVVPIAELCRQRERVAPALAANSTLSRLSQMKRSLSLTAKIKCSASCSRKWCDRESWPWYGPCDGLCGSNCECLLSEADCTLSSCSSMQRSRRSTLRRLSASFWTFSARKARTCAPTGSPSGRCSSFWGRW